MTFDEKYYNIGFLDQLSYKNTFVHRLDPRAKLIATLFFLFTVISFSKYEIVALLPFFLYPMLLMTIGEIPFTFIIKKVLIVSPFAVFIGIFNPLLDSGHVFIFNGLTISAGWLSFFSIILKFTLTVSTALLLVATTSFPGVCHSLRQLGLPSLFVSQLLFLYRYIFVLMEETMRIVRARNMQSFEQRGKEREAVKQKVTEDPTVWGMANTREGCGGNKQKRRADGESELEYDRKKRQPSR